MGGTADPYFIADVHSPNKYFHFKSPLPKVVDLGLDLSFPDHCSTYLCHIDMEEKGLGA